MILVSDHDAKTALEALSVAIGEHEGTDHPSVNEWRAAARRISRALQAKQAELEERFRE
jgi:hypothetical protein